MGRAFVETCAVVARTPVGDVEDKEVGGSAVGKSGTRVELCGREAGEASLRGRNGIYTWVSQSHLHIAGAGHTWGDEWGVWVELLSGT